METAASPCPPWTVPRRFRYPGPMHAVLFDLDDTLTDRARSLWAYGERFAVDFASALRLSDPTALAPVFLEADGGGYRPKEEVAARLCANLPWVNSAAVPPPVDLITHWRRIFPTCARPAAGLAETLAALDAGGVPWGIVTNGGGPTQRAKLEALGLVRRPRAVAISEEVGLRKPDPRIFALALEMLGLSAPGVWFVGDHPTNDVLGATSAGLAAVWLVGRHPWPDGAPTPPYRIRQLPELLSLLPER